MARKLAQPHPDRLISVLAARQHGVVGRSQLTALGLTAAHIEGRLRRGALHRIHRGVYAVGHPRVAGPASHLAAVLACGPGAALSHRSAAALWAILPTARERVEVSVDRDRRVARARIEVHHTALSASELTVVQATPVTTPGRTLVDLADVISVRALERAFDEAEYLRLDFEGLRVRPGRRGAGRLARVLRDHDPGATRTRSVLEELFLEICREHRVPRPAVNVRLYGHEVDFLWRRERLVAEVDGRRAHGTSRAFEHDRLRDAELTERGYTVIRFTWRRLNEDPAGASQRLLRLLRRAAIDSPA